MIPLQKLQEMVDKQADKVAVIQGERQVTWRELHQLVDHAVQNLILEFSAQGFGRTAYMSEQNYLEVVLLMSAFSTLKVPFSGLDFTATLEAKMHCLKTMKADCLFYSTQFAEEAQAIREQLGIRTICINEVAEMLTQQPAQRSDFDLSSTDRSFESLSFTSGTSGLPKVVYRNKPFEARRFAYLAERYHFTDQDRFLVSLPFYHVSASGWGRLFLSIGGSIVLGDVYDPAGMAQDICTHNVTTSLIVPPVLQRITHVFQSGAVSSKPNMKFIMVGGKNFPATLRKAASEVFGPILHEYYGSTETGVNTLADAQEVLERPDTVGKLMDGSHILILDDSNQPLPVGLKGQVAIASYQNMVGYIDKEADIVEIEGELYVITPDYGWFDEEGYLHLASRSDRDTNIYSIENELRTLPGVFDSYVLMEGGVALVALATGGTATADDLREAAVAILTAHGIKSYKLLAMTEIPYSMSGKVKQKQFVTEMEKSELLTI